MDITLDNVSQQNDQFCVSADVAAKLSLITDKFLIH